MSGIDFLIGILMTGGAFAAAAAGILSFGLALHVVHRCRKYVAPAILSVVALLGMANILLSGRSLTAAEVAFVASSEGDRWPSRLLIAGLIVGCAAVILNWLFRSDKQTLGRLGTLLAGIGCYYFSFSFLPSVVGFKPQVELSQYYALFAIFGIFLSQPSDAADMERAAKNALLLVLAASGVVALIHPPLVLQADYEGLFPGFHWRLWGAVAHANVLAPIALTFILLEWHRPYGRAGVHRFALVFGFTILVFTQSKTTWIAGVVAWAIIFFYRYRQRVAARGALEASRKIQQGAALVLGVLALAAFAGLMLSLSDSSFHHGSSGSAAAAADLETGTGRNLIWEAALQEVKRHPVFGYGPPMWGEQYRAAVGLSSAFHAHNQVLQVLSVSGFVGLAGFLIYLFILMRYSWRAARYTNGISLGLFAVLLIRSVSETPLPINVAASGDFLAHLAFVCLLIAAERAMPPEPERMHAKRQMAVA